MCFKRFFVLVGSILLSSITLPAVAATFEVPRSFEIMYIDLQDAGQFGNDFKVDLVEGQHQIVVRFNKSFRSDGDTQKIKSEPIVIDVMVEKDAYLTMKAPYISSQEQAESYAKSPTFSIVDDLSGREVKYTEQMLPSVFGLQNTRDYRHEIERLNKNNAVIEDAPESAPIIMVEDVSLEMMKFWYNRSDEDTRKNIRIWLNDNLYKPTVTNIEFEMAQFWINKADKEKRKAFQTWVTQ